MPQAATVMKEMTNALEQWAIRYGFNNDPYVSGLLGSLKTRKQISFWSELRATEMLPLPEPQSSRRLRARMPAFLAFRNIMVFVPIAFTWAAISQATTAFSEYTNQGAAKVVNFFDFWENGYEVLPKFWTLSNVARIDFFLLASIIVVSIAISVSERRIEKLESSEKDNLDRERLQLALNLDELLHAYRKPTSVLVNRQISQSIINLNEATKALRSAAKEQATITKNSANYKEVLSELASIKSILSKLR